MLLRSFVLLFNIRLILSVFFFFNHQEAHFLLTNCLICYRMSFAFIFLVYYQKLDGHIPRRGWFFMIDLIYFTVLMSVLFSFALH